MTFRALAIRQSEWRRANARNVRFFNLCTVVNLHYQLRLQTKFSCGGKHQVDVVTSTQLIKHCAGIVEVMVEIPDRQEIFRSFLVVARKTNSKVRSLLRPITTVANSPTNQTEFLGIICDSLKDREKSREQGVIGFGFASC